MTTIKEVAELAGVSIGTASNVITRSVRVSEPLRLKVQAAIRKLDYHPNHVARSLKTSKTRTLGIIVPDMTISFYPQLIRGAEAAARVRGYSMISVTSDDSADRQKELLSLLRSQRVEGILLVIAAAPVPPNEIRRIVHAQTPMVCLDRIPEMVAVDTVSVDDVAAAEMGVAHLVSVGHRRIAIATGPLSLRNERQRLLGCRRALKRAGLNLERDLLWEGNLYSKQVAAMCQQRLLDSGRRPDAIFATNGPTALGVLRALRACGLQTPGDIAFATFDELTIEDLFTPAITTVVQPAYDIGLLGARILLERIEQGGEREEPVAIRLPASLKVRESSASRLIEARAI